MYQDIYPVICYLFRKQIPINLDGKLPNDIFTSEFRSEFQPEYGKDIENLRHTSSSDWGKVSQQDIEDRLKGLGYL